MLFCSWYCRYRCEWYILKHNLHSVKFMIYSQSMFVLHMCRTVMSYYGLCYILRNWRQNLFQSKFCKEINRVAFSKCTFGRTTKTCLWRLSPLHTVMGNWFGEISCLLTSSLQQQLLKLCHFKHMIHVSPWHSSLLLFTALHLTLACPQETSSVPNT